MRRLIIIPAHNKARTIASVLEKVRQIAAEFDVVVVNDGSTDQTPIIVRNLGVIQLDLPCNLRYARPVQTGLIFCSGAQLRHD